MPVELDDGLKELGVGELEGLLAANLGTTFSKFLMRWWQGEKLGEKLPGGESLVELQQRSWAVVERLLAKHNDGTLVTVSHYFVILTIILKALDLPLASFIKFKLDPGGISMLEFGDYGTRLIAFNDTSYLNYGKG